VGPEVLFTQEPIRSGRQADDAHVRGAGVGVEGCGEFGPVRVDDTTGQDVHPVAHPAHRQGDLLDVDQLSAEVRVLAPVLVGRVEVPLRVQEGDVHGGSPHRAW